MAERFVGNIALVTGGSSGIGRATAHAFAREGATVIVADINGRGGEETVSSITLAGGKASAIVTDVTQSAAVGELVSGIVESWGHLDCAFNNAGIVGGSSSWQEVTEDIWERVMMLNLTGVWLCMRAEIRQMLSQGHGSIVNMSSIFGLTGNPTNPAYTASKHGIIGLTKSAALAYAQEGIRVNAVCPGYIDTPMSERVFSRYPERKAAIIGRHPLGRLGTPEEVAEAVVWLCSDGARYITGHALSIDGGYVAQ
jgi:NAD(P)-dependent dehydrogenase (short-subunit alcohol dehydrogenase family)